ncbi:MAG: polysaccharide lyase, partial [Lachnospira sp.]
MRKNQKIKKYLSQLLAATLIAGSVIMSDPMKVTAATTSSVTFQKVGGWYETIYAEINGVSDADVTGVSYSGTMNGSLTGDDLNYLVRNSGGLVRIDIPGLKAGNYSLSVTTSSGTITQNDITVLEYDRSGYAHYNYTSGVGAYNDDGTLKDNAIVVYVTEENKNIVSVTSKDGTTVTGIGHILNSSGRDNGDGLTPKGGTPNNNNSIMRRLADDGTPLVVRIIGTVSTPDGVTKKASLDYGGFLKDNGNMAAIQSGKDVTIEGIGTDATIDGWGIHFMCQSDYPQYGKSFETRNLSFVNVPEDCVGMDGGQSNGTLTYPVERIWVHHCAFHVPTVDNPTEEDKAHGDGACDFKKGQYFTNSYCFYDGYNKTNLLGGNDDNVQYNLTYHHNYWKNCQQRMPLARHANIHMYNNYFYGAGSYCMEVRMNAYIFAEYNIYEKCNNPASIKAGAIKSYNNTFSNCTGTNGATIVTDKSKTVSSSNKYANFDTNSSLSYIPSGSYKLNTELTGEQIADLTGPMSDKTCVSAGTGSGSGDSGSGDSGSGD